MGMARETGGLKWIYRSISWKSRELTKNNSRSKVTVSLMPKSFKNIQQIFTIKRAAKPETRAL